MKPFPYLAGIASMADGVIHLLFPGRWDALWIAETRKFLPQLGQRLEQCYRHCPMDFRRGQGLGWMVARASNLPGLHHRQHPAAAFPFA